MHIWNGTLICQNSVEFSSLKLQDYIKRTKSSERTSTTIQHVIVVKKITILFGDICEYTKRT